jgi:hypothetical protein
MEDYNTLSPNLPNILFLKGISEDDHIPIGDQADEKYTLKSSNELLNECYMYGKNNIKFLSSEKWPSKTNLHCWNCDFTFDNDSIFVPIYIKECITGGLEFGIKGNMCSFNCVMSYILDKTGPGTAERWKYINNLKILYFIKNGIHVSDIKPAPDKFNLIKYGGTWTNEVFLEELKKLNISKELKMPHLENAIIERKKIVAIVKSIIDDNKKTIRTIDDIEDDCVIYNGNRMSLGGQSIWALSKGKIANASADADADADVDVDANINVDEDENFDFNKFLLEAFK